MLDSPPSITGDRPDLLLLDVNETLSDLSPLPGVFASIGLAQDQAQQQAETWFARVLAEGFAATLRGTAVPFADIGRSVAASMLDAAGADPAGADRVIAAFGELDVHPDVPPGLRALARSGVRLVTLSNDASAVARGLLERAGLSDVVEAVLSVEDAGAWKPAAAAYDWALQQCGVTPARAALAAVHPWDVAGALHAGLAGVLIDRGGAAMPDYLPPATLAVDGFEELARTWA